MKKQELRAGLIMLNFFAAGIVGAISMQVLAQTPQSRISHKLTLAEAERILLERNLTVTAAKYQIESVRAAKLIASFKPNPVLTLGAEQLTLSGAFWNNLIHTDPNVAAQSTYTIRLDKVIERGGKRELRTEQADFQLKANEALMLDAIRTQIFQLRQAFTAATLARENLLLAEATEQQYQQTEKLTEAKVENGSLPGFEIYRARAGRLQYQQTVLQARTAYELAARDILNLLSARSEDVEPAETSNAQKLTGDARIVLVGNTPERDEGQQISASLKNTPIEIVGTFDDRPIIQNLDELRTTALRERPDVIAAKYIYESAERSVSLAQAQRVRDLSVGTFYQRVGGDNALGVNVSVPLLIYNNGRAGISQAEAQRKASETIMRQAELQATTDVEKAYQTYISARRTLDLYGPQNLVHVEKLRNIAALSYKEGASSLFELLDAQRTYNQAISSYNQARADYQNSIWQLEASIGRTLR